jgi:RES domain-containing protein
MTVWRIAARAHAALDGEGACLYGSRWTPRGKRAVFAAATLSLAALERFVHTDPDLEPDDLVAVEIQLPPDAGIEHIETSRLPARWRAYPAPAALVSLGERWLRGGTTLALAVPSAVIPRERNFVLNPAHLAFARIEVVGSEPFTFDPRMWK